MSDGWKLLTETQGKAKIWVNLNLARMVKEVGGHTTIFFDAAAKIRVTQSVNEVMEK